MHSIGKKSTRIGQRLLSSMGVESSVRNITYFYVTSTFTWCILSYIRSKIWITTSLRGGSLISVATYNFSSETWKTFVANFMNLSSVSLMWRKMWRTSTGKIRCNPIYNILLKNLLWKSCLAKYLLSKTIRGQSDASVSDKEGKSYYIISFIKTEGNSWFFSICNM